jgi:hypothetical protein
LPGWFCSLPDQQHNPEKVPQKLNQFLSDQDRESFLLPVAVISFAHASHSSKEVYSNNVTFIPYKDEL